MLKLNEELNNFKSELLKLMKNGKVIISGFKEFGEGETKIVNYINNNDVGMNICTYSPDADVNYFPFYLKIKI